MRWAWRASLRRQWETFDDALPFDVDIPVVTPGEIERLEVDLAGLRARIDEVAGRVAKHSDRHLAKVSCEIAEALPQLARGSDPRGALPHGRKADTDFCKGG